MRKIFADIAQKHFREAKKVTGPIMPAVIEPLVKQFLAGPPSAIDLIKKAIRENDKAALENLIGTVEKPLTANINQTDEIGYTPLHMAVLANNPEMVKMLLDRGANKDAQTLYGKTPRALAVEKGFKGIIEILDKHGSQGKTKEKEPEKIKGLE